MRCRLSIIVFLLFISNAAHSSEYGIASFDASATASVSDLKNAADQACQAKGYASSTDNTRVFVNGAFGIATYVALCTN